jgi:hypothetical protein
MPGASGTLDPRTVSNDEASSHLVDFAFRFFSELLLFWVLRAD